MVEFLQNIKKINKTSIFFVSSHKLDMCLNIITKEFDKTPISVSKELTKLNEKTYRGLACEVKDLISEKKENFKGEFVIAVEGIPEKRSDLVEMQKYENKINKLLSKFSLTDVVEIVHNLTGISKNKVYKWVLKIKKSQD